VKMTCADEGTTAQDGDLFNESGGVSVSPGRSDIWRDVDAIVP